MRIHKALFITLAFALFVSYGCKKDTNEITPQAVEKANADRIKAIDNDPNMTPEGREKMKEMLGLVPGKGRAVGRDRSGNPTK